MKIDGFLLAIAAAVAAAFAAPMLGTSRGPLHMAQVTDLGVALVFFLHGAAVSPQSMLAAITNWRLHAVIQASTYILFPLLGVLVWFATPNVLGQEMRLGFFFLCAISSTISSSVAMTAMARGNVSGAIFNATLSGIIGMILTPVLMGLVMAVSASGQGLFEQIGGIFVKLLLPFIVGQILRPWLAAALMRWKVAVGKADKTVIVLIVYASFCDAVAAGMWTRGNALAIFKVLAMCLTLLALVLAIMRTTSRALHFSIEDEITAMFCGSKKSLANGAPIAKVIFGANPALSLILIPLLLYHQIQLVVCAVIARRYAARSESLASKSENVQGI